MCSQLVLNLDTSESMVYYNGESVCIALCNLALHYKDEVNLWNLLVLNLIVLDILFDLTLVVISKTLTNYDLKQKQFVIYGSTYSF